MHCSVHRFLKIGKAGSSLTKTQYVSKGPLGVLLTPHRSKTQAGPLMCDTAGTQVVAKTRGAQVGHYTEAEGFIAPQGGARPMEWDWSPKGFHESLRDGIRCQVEFEAEVEQWRPKSVQWDSEGHR